MLAKRIIPCLDVDNGRVVKGVQFVDIKDAGDPVEVAKRYNEQGADEITFLDITKHFFRAYRSSHIIHCLFSFLEGLFEPNSLMSIFDNFIVNVFLTIFAKINSVTHVTILLVNVNFYRFSEQENFF